MAHGIDARLHRHARSILRRRACIVALLVTTGLLAGFTESALATKIHRVNAGSQLKVDAGKGQANEISIVREGSNLVIRDEKAKLNLDKSAVGCTKHDDRRSTCPIGSISNIYVDGRDLNDKIRLDQTVTLPASLHGGAGKDVLKGGRGNDELFGEAGDEDRIDCGGHVDLGRDRMSGGAGDWDTACYDGRTTAVSVTLDDLANDGQSGEADNVASDIERLISGSGNDTLVANGGRDHIFAGPGDDLMDGGTGGDYMYGESGNDAVFYWTRTARVNVTLGDQPVVGCFIFAWDGCEPSCPGRDIRECLPIADDGEVSEKDGLYWDTEIVVGGAGNDRLAGSQFNNYLIGMGGEDTLIGNKGSDLLDGFDGGRDTLDCGPDFDAVRVDPAEHAIAACEGRF